MSSSGCSENSAVLVHSTSRAQVTGQESTTATALFVRHEYRDLVFSQELFDEIAALSGATPTWIDPAAPPGSWQFPSETEVLFCTWGTPLMDRAFLDALPDLRAVFYAAGSPKSFLTEEFFKRGISLSTAASANAVPVAEFTVAAIIFSLKQVLQSMRETRTERIWNKKDHPLAGCYRSRVGLVSLGLIGRRVATSLQAFDIEVVAHDPHFPATEASALGVGLATLEEVFETCDVVSLHTPLLTETTGMITGDLLERMKPNATLINTARGGVIRETELCQVLKARPDLTAILDVTEPEPPLEDSPLWDLPNVFLTPHISGSLGPECRRMARSMVDEFRLFLSGAPLRHRVLTENLARIA